MSASNAEKDTPPLDQQENELDFEKVVPENKAFVEIVHQKVNSPLIQEHRYGHAAAHLAIGLKLQAHFGKSQEEQRVFLRECAKRIIAKHGPKIIDFMRDELKLSLTEEDLKELGLQS